MIDKKVLLASSMIAGIVAASMALAPTAASAQSTGTTTEETTTTTRRESTEVDSIVVTGSRIRRDEFNSASPVQIITRTESVLAGTASTAEILQGGTVTSGSAQVDNAFLGFVTEGGPGANTLGLRGLGSIRTLVLLNGRRLAPAGTRGQVGQADLNTLPSAMVERIEILKDGASSIYGSDAVAGVVNIITRNDIDGFTFEGFTDQTFDGGGAQYRASAVAGKTFDRGNIAVSFEHLRGERIRIKDRDWANCGRGYRYNPTTGASIDDLLPDGSGIRCNGLNYGGGIAHDYIGAWRSSTGARTTLTSVPGFVGTYPGAGTSTAFSYNGWQNVNATNARPLANPGQLEADLWSPIRSYTFYTNGNYDLGILGGAEAYGELLYTRRESSQVGARQLSLDPFGSERLGYYYNAPSYGANNPLFPTVLANAGFQFINPFIFWGNDRQSQEVDYFRASAGLRGDLGFGNWRYDANLMFAKSDASYSFQSFITDRLRQSLNLVAAPAGFNSAYAITAPAGTVGAGGTYTCASNIGNANPQCVPANLLTEGALNGTEIPQALRSWLFTEVTGNTTYEQTTFQFAVDGDLFTLPAGKVGAAFGVELRHDELNDTPPIESQTRSLYNLTSATPTRGKDDIWEVFGEVNVPLLANQPLAKQLDLALSARHTDYDSYGSSDTYKVGLTWTPVDWLKVRGTHGTSFRAPGIYERTLGGQSGFYGTTSDPCYDYQADLDDNGVPQTIAAANCQAELTALLGATAADNFLPTGGPQVYSSGNPDLEAEKSKSDTIGFVIQPDGLDLSFAVDYFRIKIRDQVANFGTAVLSGCYNDPQFRAGGGLCNFVAARNATTGNLTYFIDNYVNVASQGVEGFDFTIRYTRDIGEGRFISTLRATNMKSQTYRLSDEDPIDEYAGFPGYPKWVGDLDLRYEYKDWTFRWGVDYVEATNAAHYYELPVNSGYHTKVEGYFEHAASVQFQGKNDWEATVGVNNIFGEEPPIISPGLSVPRVGSSHLYSGYDNRGRSLFVNVTKSF